MNRINYFPFRWGRVGESGQNAMHGPFNDFDDAEKSFSKKYQDKTKNKWADRDNFKPVPGKYTLLEMGDEEDGEDEEPAPVVSKKSTSSASSTKPKAGSC